MHYNMYISFYLSLINYYEQTALHYQKHLTMAKYSQISSVKILAIQLCTAPKFIEQHNNVKYLSSGM